MKSGFRYVDALGSKITDAEQVERIKGLVVPPAWRHVRISPGVSSRIQAVGVDTTGRVQYIYHPKFVAKQQRKKFSKIETFGKYLPQMRAATNKHLELEGFPREKVLAVMTRLINSLYVRVGSEKSVKKYRTYGITTLQNRHLTVHKDGRLVFDFVGKSHVKQRTVLSDPELVAIMTELKSLGSGRKLFNYINGDGAPHPVKPKDINGYIKELTSSEFSSKDLRTWGATILAAVHLAELGVAENEADQKKNIVRAVKDVAEKLGNTPAVCRSSYIHPTVIKAYEKGIVIDDHGAGRSGRKRKVEAEYEPEEQSLLRLFKTFHR